MKYILLCVFGIFIQYLAFGACPASPSKPATFSPAGADDLDVSTTSGGITRGAMPNSSGNYVLPSPGNHRINTGNVGSADVIIYVKAGQTLEITNSYTVNSGGSISIYVEEGWTLNLNFPAVGTLNSGNFYIWGTMNLNVNGGIQNFSNFYVLGANAKLLAPTYINLTSSTGQFIVDGGSLVTGDIRINTVPADEFCIRNGGCISTGNISVNNTVGSFASPDGNGYLYVRNNYTVTPNQRILNTTNAPKVCTGESPINSRWCGGVSACVARVKGNCKPPSQTCADAIALPISFHFFKTSISKEGAIATWGVNKTWDSDYFIIEKSTNGVNWVLDGTIPSYNGNEYSEYSFTDPNPADGITYYRLSEVDRDGRITPYSVSFVEYDRPDEYFSIFPNPAGNTFSVNVSEGYPQYDLEITDAAGKYLTTYSVKGGVNHIDHNLPAGIYVAKLKLPQESKFLKLIIN